MPETITEMIIPGVYIEVRAEGLIGAGGVSLANLGVIGTANRGAVGQVQILSSAAEVKTAFGTPGAFTGTSDDLSLARSLDLLFANGARTVYAIRVAKNADPAEFVLSNGNKAVATLTALTPGDWANNLAVSVKPAEAPVLIRETITATGAAELSLKRTPAKDARTVVKIKNGPQVTIMAEALVDQEAKAETQAENVVRVVAGNKKITFGARAIPPKGAEVEVQYAVAAADACQVTLEFNGVKERFSAPDGAYLADLLKSSQFVSATAPTNADSLLTPTAAVLSKKGTNGAKDADGEYQAALDLLANQDVHVVVAPGLATDKAYALLNAHCQAAVDNGKERIAVIGTDKVAQVRGTIPDAEYAKAVAMQTAAMGSDRIIFVAPGIRMLDQATGQAISLPGTYAAAAVAGMISKLSAHISPTNKEVGGIASLEQDLTPGEIKLLLNNRVLVMHKQSGFRVVRGITTAEKPWDQVTTRRIVDYAKLGIRQGAQPYIGRLNNDRVRKALKGTLDGFLTGMVQDEMLISYELDVFATRDDEINNRCVVTATLRPTFSIDFIKVVMNLE